MKKIGISLFSSSGIGELGIKENNIEIVLANELLSERAELYSYNYPETKMIIGDIWEKQDEIIEYYKNNFKENPFVIIATPPCQGMSSNGMGKILNEYRNGKRDKFDPRNQLIIPTIRIIKELQPDYVILENVPNMKNTIILDDNGDPINIIDYIFLNLDNYKGTSEVVNTADYGLPQVRKRLITTLTKEEKGLNSLIKQGTLLPRKTHGKAKSLLPYVTLRDSIGSFPKIDAVKGKNSNKEFNYYHFCSIMDPKKYIWVKNTKEGDSAFNNQCINPDCLFQGNQLHGTKVIDNINRASTTTPLYCQKCNSLLPRPFTVDKKTNEIRIMRGYTSAYKRMNWDQPAPTLTMNFPYISSDNKIHPNQNRPLSIYEAMVLQSISNYNFKFKFENYEASNKLIIESIGESVPPLLIDLILKNIIN